MTTDTWDEFEMPGSGDFPDAFKFDTIGASIAGEVTNVRKVVFDDKAVPELWIVTADGERSVLCGQANLLTQLIELRPIVGDRISIVYASQRKAKLGMAKLFDVALKRADGSTVDAVEPTAKTAADLL